MSRRRPISRSDGLEARWLPDDDGPGRWRWWCSYCDRNRSTSRRQRISDYLTMDARWADHVLTERHAMEMATPPEVLQAEARKKAEAKRKQEEVNELMARYFPKP